MFVASVSQALRVRFVSESSIFFSSQNRVMTWSSQRRVTRTAGSLQFIGLQARVNVESTEISNFSYVFFRYEMAPDKLQSGAQCCFNKFDCRLPIKTYHNFLGLNRDKFKTMNEIT